MTYRVNTIETIEELKKCPVFNIGNFKWTKEYRPKAFGQMALLKDYGFVISMTAIECNPLCRFTENEDPVYKDSALEAFLNFEPKDLNIGYLNFEMNAKGALLNRFGSDRNRKKVSELTSYQAICKAQIEENSWGVMLQIPMELICDVYQIKPLKTGDEFTCNFFKISEDPNTEHYASFSPIESPTPNFHLPEFFAKAVIASQNCSADNHSE